MPRIALIFMLLMGISFPGLAHGQGALRAGLSGLAAASKIKPGTWVRYTMLVRKNNSVVRVKFSALEMESEGQWFELALTDNHRRTMLFKALIKGSLAKPTGVETVIIQTHGQRPLRLPKSLAKNPFPSFTAGLPKVAKLISTNTVKVAAGTFKAKHFRIVKGEKSRDIWLSEEVQGWPLIKVDSPDVIMELAGHGVKATSAVKGKPLKLDETLAKKMGITVP